MAQQEQNKPPLDPTVPPLPDGFDISRLSRHSPAPMDLRVSVPEEERYRLPLRDACSLDRAMPVTANALGEVSRHAMRDALRRCGPASDMDLSLPLDRNTEAGPRGIGRVGVRHRF